MQYKGLPQGIPLMHVICLHLDIAVVADSRTWDKSKPPLHMRNYYAIVTVMCSRVLTRHLLPNIA